MAWWGHQIVSDAERPEWTLVPLKSVGPLQFGQSREEVAAAPREPIKAWDARKYAQWFQFHGAGVDTYYDRETDAPAAVAVDACRGPQVLFDGVRLVGRLPSELEPWIEKTAPTLVDLPEYVDGLRFGGWGEPYLLGLGLVLRCQQNGDFARTRPVFLASKWAMQGSENVESLIPQMEWLTY
ncbi:hypothetical protein [Streptomyces sp. NBC_00151]|uniref:hypothetical protein n=1 Tax=Streptomyces sp. NBC_00151 TaxID=2975669 RepID=UPI002DDA8B2E|nr:hypothetical protein [Streptomyces sp. NBC_00151]WRZ38735.1 hypothetical protein OG915_12265 [Streptomyces sp. NBC_00151]